MENIEIPDNYTGKVKLYMSASGLEIEVEKTSKTPLGPILVFIVENGEILGKYSERYDEEGRLLYAYHYN